MSDQATSALAIGSTFSGYKVLDLLSQNQLGALHLAEDADGNTVFLRIVDDSVHNFLERVEEDLSQLAEVVHRNVARVLAGAEGEDAFYYVLEALGTTTLLDLAASCRPLYERELVWLGRGLTAGLAALHEQNLHHGNLVPGSVIVSHHGPIIVDLGWEDRLGSDEGQTTEAAKLVDLAALREVLVFATSPVGTPAPFSSKVEGLLAALMEGEDGTPPSAKVAAEAWKEAASRLGLPDPMAPQSLKKLLERYEGTAAPSDSEESLIPTDSADPEDLREAPTMIDTSSQDPPDDEDDEDDEEESPPLNEVDESEDTRRETIEYAKSLLGPPDPASTDEMDPATAKTIIESTSSESSDDSSVATAPDDSAVESGYDPNETAIESTAKKPDKKKPAKQQEKKKKKKKPAKQEKPKKVAKQGKPSNRSQTGEAPSLGTFGEYELVRELAAGRTSTVYLAKKSGQTRPLALKVMLPGTLPDDTARTKFLRESQAASALQHPCIARVLDSGVEGGWAFVATEFVEGRPLSEVCREPSELSAQLPQIMLEVLRALQYAHSLGIIHGDIKPANIMVGGDGEAHILEFGIPRIPDKGQKIPPETAYTAPEVATGGKDMQADIYGVGVTLFEVATQGKLPADVGFLARLLCGSPAPPSGILAHIPWQLDAIVLKAIRPFPEERYQRVDEMADDLQRSVLGPLQAPRGDMPYRARVWAAKYPLFAALTVIAVAASVVLLGMLTVHLVKRFRAGAAAMAAVKAATDTMAAKTDATKTGEGVGGTTDGVKHDPRLAAELDRVRGELKTSQEELAAAREEREDAEDKADKLSSGRRNRAKALVSVGGELLLASQPRLAKRTYEEAQKLDPNSTEAEQGIARASHMIRNPPAAAKDPRRTQAQAYLKQGRQHLDNSRYADARTALLRALELGASDARGLLDRLQDKLVAKRVEAVDSKRKETNRRDAERLAGQGKQYLMKGLRGEAALAFQKALALDPGNSDAAAGLKELARTQPAKTTHTGAGGKSREADVRAARRVATEAYAKGQELYRRGDNADNTLDAYFKALKSIERAGVLDPSDKTIEIQKQKIARELSTVLRESGQPQFASMILKFAGLDPSKTRTVRMPKDPYLIVQEYQRVGISRAYGGTARFQRTRAFDPLRRWIRRNASRYRITVRVHSRIKPGFPPQIYATGLSLRREDKRRRTLSPWKQITFSGGPYKRIVRMDSRTGTRLVMPFTRSRPLDPKPYVKEVEELAKELIEEAKK